MSSPTPQQPVGQVRTPEKQGAGVYANGIGVWFTPTDFTLDFLVTLPIEIAAGGDGEQVLVAPQQIVSRVKIPPPLAFQLMRNLNTAMDQYEAQHGKIPDFLGGNLSG